MNKIEQRERRAERFRQRCRNTTRNRLCVFKTSKHIYAQIIALNGNILAHASTVEKDIKQDYKNTGNIKAAELIGKLIAERSMKQGITEVYLDCSGFKYHGRIKSLADTARAGGLQF